MDINSLPDAWEMVNRLTGSDNDGLYDIYYKISVALFDYRAKHGLSQKELAKMLDITLPMMAELESGDYDYTVKQLWEIAIKLNMEFDIVLVETADIT